MITRDEYLKALDIVAEYEKLQQDIKDRYKNGDMLISETGLSKRALNAFESNKWYYAKRGEELIWLSDLVKFAVDHGIDEFLKFRNIGSKTFIEIKEYLISHLTNLQPCGK